ncbi:aspartyl protease family protein [Maribellus sediminis]|uniref:aspartyl protease family protein n=1 Tax=Maribellus sediminis TaxID=2696285 RepID=UPI0014318BE0|nr:aspartyl protease family protein [Maribellus sediminis]
MKTIWIKIKNLAWLVILVLFLAPNFAQAQEEKSQSLDQNISIYAEDEPLSSVIEKICKYLDIDYQYNSQDLADKKISLNVSNKPIKYVLDKLMNDFYLLFEIEDNLLVVRDYVPLDKSMELDRNTQQFYANNRGFMFDDPRDKRLTIKFKSASNLIIIPVNINDSDTLNFILDTGVRFPIITELPFVNKLNLNYMMPVKIKGLDEGEGLTAYRSGNNSLHINGITARNQEVQMIIDEDFQISHMLGIPVHGLIGFNLFKDFVVEIDYHDEELVLYKPEYYKYRDRKNDIILPLHFDGTKPFVRTSIVTDSLKEVPVKLLVDTGASDALWLSESSDERIKIPEKHMETFLGRGLSGDLYGTKGRIDAIWVGPLLLTQPIVAFPDSKLIDSLITSNDRNGTIGAEILRRFYVTVDYRNSRLTLRPTNRIKEDFNYNMSGMEVINPIPGLPVYTIADVTENSPAYFAGIQKDDQILSINSSSHKSLELNDINLLLQSKENKKIKVKVLRDGEEIKTSFELKKMF